MKPRNILIIGGGIGGLTAAIALGNKGYSVEVIERDPKWSVYGVGIIQQANVIRAMDQLGIIDGYLDAAYGFDSVEVYIPTGQQVAKVPVPKLSEGLPASVGIGRPALHKVLGDKAKAAGAHIRLGVVVTDMVDDGKGVDVTFSDGTSGRYDMVIGADGVNSQTRKYIFPEAPNPEFSGQSVWRYNFKRPDDVTCLHVYEGRVGVGLVPLSDDLMYMYVTTAEPGNPKYPTEGIAKSMRDKLSGAAARIAELSEQIVVDADVVYRPLEYLFLEGDWSKGRIGLLGDAVHATTPHLGQGAGMAIEDSIVLAEELDKHEDPETAFKAYRERRFERCKYIVDNSLAICRGQLGQGPLIENAKATADMFRVTAEPI